MYPKLNRRHFLRSLAGVALAGTAPLTLARPHEAGSRILALHNLHTGESIEAVYWVDGQYRADALQRIDRVLRDHRTGDICTMDRSLLDQLHLLQQKTGVERPFEIISGYRSPETNARLHQASNGVAKRSLHMQGKAMDIRLPGCSLKKLRETALSMKAGGVGYYPKSGFIHVDTGRVRYW